MKTFLKLEELGFFVFSIYLFTTLDFEPYIFLLCILFPDLGMIGYTINTKVGAFTYNLTHHKAIFVLFYISGIYFDNNILLLAGITILAHSSMDRALGFGLKYSDNFKNTHLGKLK